MDGPGPVLSNVGVAPPIHFEGYQQGIATARQQRFLNQRERFQADQKEFSRQQQGSEFLSKQLDDKNYLSGTDEDDNLHDQLLAIHDKAFNMFTNGAKMSDVQAAIGPGIKQVQQYQQKAKFIKGEIEGSVNRLKRDAGYDTDALYKAAMKKAFYDTSPDGTPKLKDIDKIDPTHDYVNEAVGSDPSLTNFGGIRAYAKAAPHSTYDTTVTSVPSPGHSQTNKFTATAPSYMEIERNDETGQPNTETGKLVPKYDVITGDNNKPIGRALNNQEYFRLVKEVPSALPAIKHETEQHFKQLGQEDINWNDPKVQLYMRSVAYDELNAVNSSILKKQDIEKQSAESAKLDNSAQEIKLAGSKAAAEERGRLGVKKEFGLLDDDTPPAKVKPIESLAGILSGKTDLSDAETVDVKGRKLVNVLPFITGAKLKAGAGEKQEFKGVYFDKASKQLMVQKEGEKEPKVISNPMHFLAQIAEANGTPVTQVKAILTKFGIKPGEVKESKPGWKSRGEEIYKSRTGTDGYNLDNLVK